MAKKVTRKKEKMKDRRVSRKTKKMEDMNLKGMNFMDWLKSNRGVK